MKAPQEMVDRSSCREGSRVDGSLDERYKVVSSAYAWILEFSGRESKSFMYIENRSGPSKVPWGQWRLVCRV